MIFADLDYEGDYWDHHDRIVALITRQFANVESGHQCDSWIWVREGEHKVAVDSFSSMKHQVKSRTRNNPLVAKVISCLKTKYDVRVFEEPEVEPHEEE